MSKLKIGKFAYQILLTSVVAAVILLIVSYILNAITPSVGEWNGILTLVISAGFFIWATKINPGDEKFAEFFPRILIALGILQLVSRWVSLPEAMPFTLVGLAFGFGSVFLANAVIKKFL